MSYEYKVGKRFLHRNTGASAYEVLSTTARIQFSGNRYFEEEHGGTDFTVYRGVHNRRVFVRPTLEFFDGRFEEVA